jgi:ribosomal protein S18 acetylase RimI-like enzyme
VSGFTYREAVDADAEALAAFARASWQATFGELYPPAELDAYLDASFAPAIQRAQIATPGESYLLAFEGANIVGYCRMGGLDLPVTDASGVELHRLYVHERVKGRGVAQALMDHALAWARARGASAIYLSVWENNHRAQAFYRRHGFADHSEWSFMVGRVADRDLIWRLAL